MESFEAEQIGQAIAEKTNIQEKEINGNFDFSHITSGEIKHEDIKPINININLDDNPVEILDI